jgi:hypothetical protein
MDQFKVLFGCCRLPSGERDAVAAHPDSSHVAVLSRSQLYYFQALWPDGTVAVDESDIVDILRAIRNDSRDTPLSEAGQRALGVSLWQPASGQSSYGILHMLLPFVGSHQFASRRLGFGA